MNQNDEEQIEALKGWWERYGKHLSTACLLVLSGWLGWQVWQNHRATQAANASVLYQQLVDVAGQAKPDAARVVDLAKRLQTEHAGTHYAQFAALFVARVAANTNRWDDAAQALKPVVEKPLDADLGALARQRLARVYAAQGKVDEALQLLQADTSNAYKAGRDELRGDLLLQSGRVDEARTAYQQAREALPDDQDNRLLQLKLDALVKGEA